MLSLGRSLEIVKDLGDAETVADQYDLDDVPGTHAIGHVRMATESDVDISNAHPYWAYPFSDVAVVHNGQLTNYHQWRRRLERSGHRFQSECDSEIIAVYLAQKMSEGLSLEEAMNASLDDLDGVFTYICVTDEALGVAKDEMAAKPLVLYEGDDMVALASEEIAIRADHRPRDRDLRPVRARGAGMDALVGERRISYDARGLAEPDGGVPHVSEIDGDEAVFDAAGPDHPADQPRAALAALRAGRDGRDGARTPARSTRSASASSPAARSPSRAASATSAAA